MHKVISEWSPLNDGKYILTLDNEKVVNNFEDDYKNFLIGGKIYKPIPISHLGGKCIGVEGEGGFVGKEVEFVN